MSIIPMLRKTSVYNAEQTTQYLGLLLCEELDVKWKYPYHMQALNDRIAGCINATEQEARVSNSDLNVKQAELLALYWESIDLWKKLTVMLGEDDV